VCKSWLRIATPLFYRSLLILNESQAALLICALHANPSYARCVRHLAVMGLWTDLHDIIDLCPAVEYLDLTLDVSIHAKMEEGLRLFFSNLRRLDIKHFVLRKLPNAYLTMPKPCFAMTQLSSVIPKWRNLNTFHIAFPLPIDSAGVAMSLANALALSPKLRVVRTQLPMVWNPALLAISNNPSLEKMELWNAFQDLGDALVGTGLFLTEARRNKRLADLIGAGTRIIRTRAHTLGTCGPPGPHLEGDSDFVSLSCFSSSTSLPHLDS